jgi:spermidine synthase
MERMPNLSHRLGFLLMGFSFTVTQSLLIRELLVAFSGNELSIGLILGNWLLLEAIGSGVMGRLSQRWGTNAASFATLQVLFAFCLPVCLWAVYNSRQLVGAVPGEGVGLVSIFATSLLILVPLALVDGTMFTFGCRAYTALTGDENVATGWVYVCEALGAIAGGLLFTLLFIPFLVALQIALLLSCLNLVSAALLLTFPGIKRPAASPGPIALLALASIGLIILFLPQTKESQRRAQSLHWGDQELVFSENSVYGNVAVVQLADQYTFFADGIPILTVPDPDLVLSEEMVHFPLSFVPQPRRALVLSGGVGGILSELLRYPLDRIDYAELDPLLIDAVRRFPTPLTETELGDPRVQVDELDGRLLVNRIQRQASSRPGIGYDLVIVNLPYPSTLQLNRLYTLEFFQSVREFLSEQGLLVISCPGSLSYMGEELRALNGMAYHTLRQVFPAVRPIPGELNLWLASPAETLLAASVEQLIERWESRGLETQVVSAPHFRLRLSQQRLDWFWSALDLEPASQQAINRDLHPVGLFFGLAYWNALFAPGVARLFQFVGQLKLWSLGLPILAVGLLMLLLSRRTNRGRRTHLPFVIGTTGFAGMTADLMIIFAFQTLYGYVYHWIGLLITAFMAGLSIGGLLMTRRLSRKEGKRATLLQLELALVLFWILLPITLSLLRTSSTSPLGISSIQGLLLLLNAVAGFLVGAQFPLANRLASRQQDSTGGTAGLLYAADLIGAFLGAILVSVMLIPVLGITETCVLMVGLKGMSLLLTALSRPDSWPVVC